MQAAALLIVSVTILGDENLAAAALHRNQQAFKQKMTPYIGKEVTVIGVLNVGKESDFIRTDDPGAVYVKAVKTEDIKKENELSRMLGKSLAVNGVVSFRESEPPHPPGQLRVGLVEEHCLIEIEKE